jgi:transposase
MEVMIAIPSVGKQTANTLLAFMPELGMLSRRQAASLAGCAPHPRDSGKTNGYRRTVGGRAHVRRALYMAAMTATNHHPSLSWTLANSGREASGLGQSIEERARDFGEVCVIR